MNFTPPAGTPTGAQSVIISDGTYTSTSTYTVASTVGGPGPTILPLRRQFRDPRLDQLDPILGQLEFAFDSTCGPNDDSGIQMITLQATGPSGGQTRFRSW